MLLHLLSLFSLVRSSAIAPSNPVALRLYSSADFAPLQNASKVPSYQSAWDFRNAAPPASFQQLEEEFKNLTFKPPTCDGSLYGHNLQTESCKQALVGIPQDTTTYTFGARGRGKWSVNLPYRFLSRALHQFRVSESVLHMLIYCSCANSGRPLCYRN